MCHKQAHGNADENTENEDVKCLGLPQSAHAAAMVNEFVPQVNAPARQLQHHAPGSTSANDAAWRRRRTADPY